MNIINPKVTVIVPIYNSAKYLEKTLEMILRQSFQELEILLIDDGSTDDSASICDAYAEKDCRCKCVHISNNGVANARNLGIDLSRGEYICFIDSDDYISYDYIESLYNAILRDNTELCICDYIDLKYKDTSFEFEKSNTDSEVIAVDDRYDFNSKYAHKTVWAAMYSKELIGDIRFTEGIYVGEDSLFYSKILLKINKISYIRAIKYAYVIYSESASHGCYNDKKFTEIKAINIIRNLYSEKSNITRDSIDVWYCTICIKGIRMMLQDDSYNNEHFEFLIRESKKNINKVMKSVIPIQSKILCLGFSICPKLFFPIYKYIHKKKYFFYKGGNIFEL